MGSGETAPAMVKVHRSVLETCPAGDAVMLDTPYGFQVNADDLTGRTVKYFAESVGRDVRPIQWRSKHDAGQDAALAQISQATWLFAGPGSPTYALDQWRDTPLPGAVRDVVRRGGTVVLGSAAAVTAGHWALPVYEIYKVGTEPAWVEGLDLLQEFLGIDVAVIPHFDNAEGGTYDTRFCYLGEARLHQLEAQLTAGEAVVGVDEHTALLCDLATATVTVAGVGGVTVRVHGNSHVLPAGTSLRVTEFTALVSGTGPIGTSGARSPDLTSPAPATAPEAQPSLERDVATQRQRFDEALERRDVSAAVDAVLAVDGAIQSWAADTLQSDAIDRARRELRAMVVRLGELARVGAVDPSSVVAPIVQALLAARARARADQDYATSDLLRDVLVEAGVAVSDTPEGVTWEFHPADSESPRA